MRFVMVAAFVTIFTVGAANAGGMSEPIMEPAIVIEESGSSGGVVVPLLLLAVIIAVAKN